MKEKTVVLKRYLISLLIAAAPLLLMAQDRLIRPGDIIVVPEKRQVWRSALTMIGSVSSILSMIYTVIMIERYTSN